MSSFQVASGPVGTRGSKRAQRAKTDLAVTNRLRRGPKRDPKRAQKWTKRGAKTGPVLGSVLVRPPPHPSREDLRPWRSGALAADYHRTTASKPPPGPDVADPSKPITWCRMFYTFPAAEKCVFSLYK